MIGKGVVRSLEGAEIEYVCEMVDDLLVLTFKNSKIICTHPTTPFDKTFNSRSNVSRTLRSEYKPIGELNCLCTKRR